MSAQNASAAVRFARLAAAVALVAVAAVIVVRLAGRRGALPAAPVAPPPEGRIVDLKERVRHQEYQDGRPVADVRGDRFFRGPDGRNHLQGSVEILSLGPAGETVSRLSAGEVVYDPGSLRFTLTGGVRVEAGGVVLEGDAFDYDREKGLFETKATGRFASKTMTGRAGTLFYTEAADEIRLSGSFEVGLAVAGRPDEALDVSGDSFVYARRERRGRVEGRALIKSAEFRGTSEALSFVASADESGFESAVLEGAARAVFGGEPAAGSAGGEIAAERIELDFGRGPSAVRSIRTAGPAVFVVRSATGEKNTVFAPAGAAELGDDGGLAGWTASGGVRIEAAAPGGSVRALEADTAAYDAAKGALLLAGASGRPAIADSSEARIEAGSISVGPGLGDLEASVSALCIFKPGEGRTPVGFFSTAKAVSASCNRLTFRGGTSSVSFAGNVRVWQGADVLRAGELDLSGDRGEMRGRGGVEAGFAEAGTAEASGRRVEAGGREMTYRSGPRALVLTGQAYVRLPPARLEAGTVSVVMGRDKDGAESLEAAANVVVTKDRYEGRAAAASYRSMTRQLVLTGRPVLTDGKGGSAKGAKLTFNLADDKILIENEGPGRATTVVRS